MIVGVVVGELNFRGEAVSSAGTLRRTPGTRRGGGGGFLDYLGEGFLSVVFHLVGSRE